MGSPGQTSVQLCVKVNPSLKGRMDRAMGFTGGTASEFVNDALKFYINYIEDNKLYITQKDADSDFEE
ncbi:MAG: hypothetical protein MJZ38_04400 [archaeon]|nr:hypothetical protein [archaeon]